MKCIIVIFLTYGAVIHLQMNKSRKRMVDSETEMLIILGASIKNNRMTPTLYSRVEKGAQILQEYPYMTAIVTGGNGSANLMSEAQLMKEILIKDFGIDEDRILIEDQSINTYENLLNTKSFINDQRAAIITSEFHTIRTAFLAKRVGVEAQSIGAKTPSNKRCKMELREHIALIKSWFFDTY